VAFETGVRDSTGVPHILEHTVLCGSERYPVRDPFFKMLNRSNATYMNAWTASDFTMYPVSSQNWTDLENLRGVYLDATFKPLLRKMDFMQEGWRLENTQFDMPKTPVIFKGVVYNEMKGAFSDTSYLFSQRMQQQLLPGTTYAHVSGGDPANITDLTHEQLVAFHRDCYHPSNAKFYTYGTYPLDKHLEALDPLLSSFSLHKRTPPTMVPQRFTEPKRIIENCAPDPCTFMHLS
jgi:presequence protease